MIHFLVAPQQLKFSVATKRVPAYLEDPRCKLTVIDTAHQSAEEPPGGMHIKYYLEFVKQMVLAFSFQPDLMEHMNMGAETRLDSYSFRHIRSEFWRRMLVEFTNEYYLLWKRTCVKSPDYDEVDKAVHIALCTRCRLRDSCDVDCPALDASRNKIFSDGTVVDSSTLKPMFYKFLTSISGRRLPELHRRYEPSRPPNQEETDSGGDMTITPGAAFEEDAAFVEAEWDPEDDPLGR